MAINNRGYSTASFSLWFSQLLFPIYQVLFKSNAVPCATFHLKKSTNPQRSKAQAFGLSNCHASISTYPLADFRIPTAIMLFSQ